MRFFRCARGWCGGFDIRISMRREFLHANVKSKAAPEDNICWCPSVLTFVKLPTATPYECQNRDTSGCGWHPAFPAPSHVRGPMIWQKLGSIRPRERGAVREIILDYQGIRHNEGWLIHLAPLAGRGRIALAIRVRGIFHRTRSVICPSRRPSPRKNGEREL